MVGFWAFYACYLALASLGRALPFVNAGTVAMDSSPCLHQPNTGTSGLGRAESVVTWKRQPTVQFHIPNLDDRPLRLGRHEAVLLRLLRISYRPRLHAVEAPVPERQGRPGVGPASGDAGAVAFLLPTPAARAAQTHQSRRQRVQVGRRHKEVGQEAGPRPGGGGLYPAAGLRLPLRRAGGGALLGREPQEEIPAALLPAGAPHVVIVWLLLSR